MRLHLLRRRTADLILLALISCLLVGCAASLTTKKPVSAIEAQYAAIEIGMTEDEVVALLGKPDRRDLEGKWHWKHELRTWFGTEDRDYVELTVSVDHNGRISETTVTSSTTTHSL